MILFCFISTKTWNCSKFNLSIFTRRFFFINFWKTSV